MDICQNCVYVSAHMFNKYHRVKILYEIIFDSWTKFEINKINLNMKLRIKQLKLLVRGIKYIKLIYMFG